MKEMQWERLWQEIVMHDNEKDKPFIGHLTTVYTGVWWWDKEGGMFLNEDRGGLG